MTHRVLVVDDEADITELLTYNFRDAGYEVLTAGDGMAAVSLAQRWLPEAIVLDLNLPGLDGFAVCEMLRVLPSTRDIPILMLTAFATEQSRAVGLRLGANGYLTKPFSPRDVVARVAELVSQAGNELPAA
ncbi:MAG: two-component system OmpR family alkaline phosphatase synthesis response regulator PhoP [Limisphaerales bacterium]|nr:MAG: two-component system OmpR family alkaline phosphatase synthesis response regulator PhoP [Limisphaerales bacterium]KAG0507409.1 MAG: two-component system OmpR family alkaline phosphatase synthesis response regulator PhoP [Limisphaerales bacterium]TXT51359.1 MAG: two-component system OmpR family alkaline phosphatase synthesis response regulator PhoP [Limisphaerales bacterium]